VDFFKIPVFYFTIYAVNYFISSKARYFTKTIFKKLSITAFSSKSYKNIRTKNGKIRKSLAVFTFLYVRFEAIYNIIKTGNANSIKTESVSDNETFGKNALPDINNISHSDTKVNDLQNFKNNIAEV